MLDETFQNWSRMDGHKLFFFTILALFVTGCTLFIIASQLDPRIGFLLLHSSHSLVQRGHPKEICVRNEHASYKCG
jgi:hypothetical protein